LKWTPNGVLASAGPATYKIPAIGDTPANFNVALYDSENPEHTVFKSKAVGEPPFMLAISVWCALRDAILSISGGRYQPVLNTPATPEAILTAVADAKQWLVDNNRAGAND
jgi:xanthine dehydrogenase large subunit